MRTYDKLCQHLENVRAATLLPGASFDAAISGRNAEAIRCLRSELQKMLPPKWKFWRSAQRSRLLLLLDLTDF